MNLDLLFILSLRIIGAPPK